MRYNFHIATLNSPKGVGRDLLKGAAAIAEFVLGDREQRRTIYHLAETGRLPTFKMGSTLYARRSTLLLWIRAQEDRCKNTVQLGEVL